MLGDNIKMLNQFFTRIERKMLLSRLKALLAWLFLIGAYVFFFLYDWRRGIFFLFLLPMLVAIYRTDNWYFPAEDYFRKYAFKHSKEERWNLSEKCSLKGRYLYIGQAIFLEDFVLLEEFGVVLFYSEIREITYKTMKTRLNDTRYRLIFRLKKAPRKYACDIYNSEKLFVGRDCKYRQACELLRQKNKNQTPNERQI